MLYFISKERRSNLNGRNLIISFIQTSPYNYLDEDNKTYIGLCIGLVKSLQACGHILSDPIKSRCLKDWSVVRLLEKIITICLNYFFAFFTPSRALIIANETFSTCTLEHHELHIQYYCQSWWHVWIKKLWWILEWPATTAHGRECRHEVNSSPKQKLHYKWFFVFLQYFTIQNYWWQKKGSGFLYPNWRDRHVHPHKEPTGRCELLDIHSSS